MFFDEQMLVFVKQRRHGAGDAICRAVGDTKLGMVVWNGAMQSFSEVSHPFEQRRITHSCGVHSQSALRIGSKEEETD